MTYTKAVLHTFGGPEVLHVETAQQPPEPGPGEVRIRVEAATVSNTDTLVRKGIYPLLKDKPPFTPGYDFVGRVDKLGAGVLRFRIGDRVADICQTGGYATHLCRPASELLTLPDDITATDAACLVLSGMTAYQIFKHAAAVQPGETFLVHGGSGAVGSTLLQLCRHHGVRAVTTASAAKHPALARYGAAVIDYHADDYAQQLQNAAGPGFDAALDFTNQRSFNQSFRLLKRGGRFVSDAVHSSAKEISRKSAGAMLQFGLDFALMMAKITLWNTLPNGKRAQFFGIVDSKRDFPERYQHDLNELAHLVKTRAVTPLIHQMLPLTGVADAHRLLDKGQVTGHLVVTM